VFLSQYQSPRQEVVQITISLGSEKVLFYCSCCVQVEFLPAGVVNAPSVDAFKERLDRFWSSQEVRFNYKAEFELWIIPSSTGHKLWSGYTGLCGLRPVTVCVCVCTSSCLLRVALIGPTLKISVALKPTLKSQTVQSC